MQARHCTKSLSTGVTGLICSSTASKTFRIVQGVGEATIEIWGPVQCFLADNPVLLYICLMVCRMAAFMLAIVV